MYLSRTGGYRVVVTDCSHNLWKGESTRSDLVYNDVKVKLKTSLFLLNPKHCKRPLNFVCVMQIKLLHDHAIYKRAITFMSLKSRYLFPVQFIHKGK